MDEKRIREKAILEQMQLISDLLKMAPNKEFKAELFGRLNDIIDEYSALRRNPLV